MCCHALIRIVGYDPGTVAERNDWVCCRQTAICMWVLMRASSVLEVDDFVKRVVRNCDACYGKHHVGNGAWLHAVRGHGDVVVQNQR